MCIEAAAVCPLKLVGSHPDDWQRAFLKCWGWDAIDPTLRIRTLPALRAETARAAPPGYKRPLGHRGFNRSDDERGGGQIFLSDIFDLFESDGLVKRVLGVTVTITKSVKFIQR